LLENILPVLFLDDLFKIIVNSAASEHSARMTSMDNATRNAKKMISELTLKYNSLRQSAITTELIEIISGAEAI
jgi:F-type H+-transporting ATPase subunit gamma